MRFTVKVEQNNHQSNRWDVFVNEHKLGTVVRSPAAPDDEKNAYHDWIILGPSETEILNFPGFVSGRFATLDDAAWKMIRSVANFEKGTLQQRTVVDLNLAETEEKP